MAKKEIKRTYKPLRDFILIDMLKVDEKQLASGIFLPENAWHDHEPIADIIAIGPDVKLAEVGKKVLINPYAVLDIPGEENLKIIKELDIIADVE